MRAIAAIAIVALALIPATSDPIINAVAPEGLSASNNAQLITVTGDQFKSGLQLQLARPDRTVATYQGPDITAQRNSSFQVALKFDIAGAYAMTVKNPDGGQSPSFAVRVDAARAREVHIDQVTPGEITKSHDAQVVTIAGRGFEAGLKVSIGDPTGNVVTAETVDDVKATAVTLRFTFQFAGQYEIVVTNPSGQTSNTVVIQVKGAAL